MPNLYHCINVYDKSGKLVRTEKHYGNGEATYEHQLRAFMRAVDKFQPGQGGLVQSESGGVADDPVNTMRAIDMIYVKGGMAVRKGDV